MEAMLSEALKGIFASGPIAAVLAYALYKLWSAYMEQLKANKELQDKVLAILANAVDHEEHDE